MKRHLMISAGVLVLVTLISGCGGIQKTSREESPLIKPLMTYQSPIIRDVAQMLYPGFLQIVGELQTRFPDNTLTLANEGLQVTHLEQDLHIKQGFYVTMRFDVRNVDTENDTGFIRQSQWIAKQYIHDIFVALSRDWNNVFSPALTGTEMIFFWKGRKPSLLRFVFSNDDAQNYLNAHMTLQEFIDRSWVEGRVGSQSLGQIELNDIGADNI